MGDCLLPSALCPPSSALRPLPSILTQHLQDSPSLLQLVQSLNGQGVDRDRFPAIG
jgi:hypothetical protein